MKMRLREWFFRLQPFFRRRKIETGLSEEIQTHIAMATEANIAAGMSPEEARYAALREFGGVEQIKERWRDERGVPCLEEFFSDIRFAARTLRKSPGFTTVAVLTLALCIGANSAVFSVVHAILLKPYPWPESDRLVIMFNSRPGEPRRGVQVPDFLDRQNAVTALAESALHDTASFNLAATGFAPEHISGLSVTPSLFPLLKARAAIGRTFSNDDAMVGAPKTVVLSDSLWRNQFGADSTIVGRDIRLSGEPYTVVGIMPPAFYYPTPATKLWVPLVFTEHQKLDSARGGLYRYLMIGRLKPGATIEQAQRELNAIQRSNAERLPQFKGIGITHGHVVGFHEDSVKDVRTLLWLVQGAVVAVLLIGCVNVASLLLARASARERELAIRAALGAGRGRLIRHLLAESVLLFVAGGLLGMVVALWGISGTNRLGVGNLPRGFEVSLDFAAVGFTLLCAVTNGVLFGALPAWSATRGDNADALKDAGARATAARRHLSLRSTLVVTQIALALMLLATAALLIKSFHRVQDVNPGFAQENVLVGQMRLAGANNTHEKRILFQNQLLERLRALPGVVSAACASVLPLSGDNTMGFEIDGVTPPDGQPNLRAVLRYVSSDYFTTLGIPLLRGRVFNDQDTRASGDVVVIDKTLADRYWPGENPIGKRLIWASRSYRQMVKWEVIGVVAPVKHASLEDRDADTIYFSTLQWPSTPSMVAVRTAGAPSQLTAAMRAAVLSVDPELPLARVETTEAIVGASMEKRRAPMILLTLFAGIALLLGAIGIYGVLAFAVGQRTKEIGVRLALGATTANIVRMILRQGATLVALGLVLGLAGYFAVSTVIRKMLFGVETTDYAALVIAPATLALVALAACLIPARRATKVDPIIALRAE